MGHLFSRAFKRLTQGGQSRNQQQQEQQNNREQQGSVQTPPIIVAESIPVGQSIDSSDYAELDTSNTRTRITTSTTTTARIEPEQNDATTLKAGDFSNDTNGIIPAEDDEKQGVEEAVIKIQALVRGHLARKALKDAHHQHHSVPPPNALGQSQFDENNLLRDPPSAIFTRLSLNNEVTQRQLQPVPPANRIQVSDSPRTSLDPIAEVPIECPNQATTTTATAQREVSQEENKKNEDRKKLSLICSRKTSSQLETPELGTRDSLSPVPSEANASIELNCDTPASASINFMSSNLVPTDKMASVLHHKRDEFADRARDLAEEAVAVATADDDDHVAQIEIGDHEEKGPSGGTRVTINENGVCGTPDSLDSEEAAAIRIQSAFRGYRTRKNSPYRTRSPNSVSSMGNVLRQQEATILDENEEQSAIMARSTNGAEQAPGIFESVPGVSDINESVLASDERRSSRTRSRDCAAIVEQQLNQRVPSVVADTTETSTEKSVQTQHQNNNHIESAKMDEPAQSDEKVLEEGTLNRESSFPLDLGELDENTIEELELSSALETARTTESIEIDNYNKVSMNDAKSIARPSIGSKSENSVETYDTDSSILGAALSLNEDLSVTNQSACESDLNISLPVEQQSGPVLEPIDEAESLNASVQLDVSKLAPCISSDQVQIEGERRLSEGALVEERKEEEIAIGRESETTLDDQEQRAIELESDDIERRDPRGQVSEKRAKSPQIRLDAPQFGITDGTPAQSEENEQIEEEKNEAHRLGTDNLCPSNGDDSGRSTPALNSSGANSSDEEDSDQEVRDTQSPNNDQTNKKQPQPGKNKKRNNRNKRKSKK